MSAERCACGHIFESAAQHQSPLETALRDEELYEGYLTARAQQAEQAALTVEQALAENPRDPELAAAAQLAQEVARSIAADLAAQRTKTSALRCSMPVKPVIVPALPAAPLLVPPPVVTVAAVRPVPLPAVTATPVTAAPISRKPVLQRASTAKKAAGVLAALKSAKAKEMALRARQKQILEPPLSAPSESAPVASSNVPPAAFRQDQAIRAEKVMEARKPDTKECPNCTASVPPNTSRCHCGFTFLSGNPELPSLTLCTGDFTALRNSLKLNLR